MAQDSISNLVRSIADGLVLVLLAGLSIGAQSIDEGALYQIIVGNKSGFIDATGKIVIPAKFDSERYMVSDFSEGMANFTDMKALNRYPFSKQGYIDRFGTVVIKPQFDVAYDFSQGRAQVKIGDLISFIDKTGKQVIKLGPYTAARSFREGLAAVYSNFEFWYIDADGRTIIPKKVGLPKDFSEDLACVYLPVEGKLKGGYIDRKGETVIPPQFEDCFDFSEGLAIVKINGKFGFIDRNGKLIVQPVYNSAYAFSNGRARVSSGDKYGFIDKTGAMVIRERYDVLTGDFSEGVAPVCENGLCGYIDLNGMYVISPRFETAYEFRGGVAKVQNPYKIGYINRLGNYIWKPTI